MTAALVLLGTSCSRQPTRSIPAHASSQFIVIEPNVSVGRVRKGMTRGEVEDTLGPPRQTNKITSFYKGMWVLFDTNGFVFNVKCIKAFAGATKEGISIGSTRADLIKTYGNPNEDKNFEDGEDMWYAASGINYWVQRGKITSFIVHLQ